MEYFESYKLLRELGVVGVSTTQGVKDILIFAGDGSCSEEEKNILIGLALMPGSMYSDSEIFIPCTLRKHRFIKWLKWIVSGCSLFLRVDYKKGIDSGKFLPELTGVVIKFDPEQQVLTQGPTQLVKSLRAPGFAAWYAAQGKFGVGFRGLPVRTDLRSVVIDQLDDLFGKYGFEYEVHEGDEYSILYFFGEAMTWFSKEVNPYLTDVLWFKAFPERLPLVSVCKEFSFDSAHFLVDYSGKCSELHGHRYVLQVEVLSVVDPESGMVIDFGDLKSIVESSIIRLYDHKCLNYVNSFYRFRPTAENMAVVIFAELSKKVPSLKRVRLYETPTSYAECDLCSENKLRDYLSLLEEETK